MGDEILLTLLMVLDALVALVLIASVLGQEAKSDGMGGLAGGSDAPGVIAAFFHSADG